VDCGAVGERNGGEAPADAARDERELDCAEPLVAADLERAELDQARPQAVSRLAREQLVDRLRQPPLLLGQLQVDAVTPVEGKGRGRR